MSILTPAEKAFLDIFLYEATTSPFTGPATKALHEIGIEYEDISFIAWAYEQEVPRTGFAWGHYASVAPLCPWASREAILQRDKEIRHLWEQKRQPASSAKPS